VGPFLDAVKMLLLAQALQGTVTGRVWDAETAKPVDGAVVVVTDQDRAVQTDESGRYTLTDVPAGEHPLDAHLMGYAPRTLRVLVPQGGTVEVDLWLLPDPVRMGPTDVWGPVPIQGTQPSSSIAFPDRVVTMAEIRSDPFLAEPDAFEVFDGGEVSLREESPSGINVRGGATDQTAYLLDGIPVFNPYHSAGVSAGWNPDALTRVSLASTSLQAEGPSALAGSVEGTTRAPGDRTSGSGSVSTTQWRATFGGPLRPIAPAGSGYLFSLRSGHPGALSPSDPTYLHGENGDWLAKLEWPAMGGRVELLGYGNENELHTIATVPPEDGTMLDPRRNLFEWSGQSLGARWSRTVSAGEIQTVVWSAEGSASSIWAARPATLDMTSNRHDRGALVSARLHSTRSSTDAALRVEEIRTSYRVRSDSTADAPWLLEASTPVLTGIVQHKRPLASRVEIELGASTSWKEGDAYVAPNAQIVWNAVDPLRLIGSYSRAHQFAHSLRNPESIAGTIFPADLYVGAGAPHVPVGSSRLALVAAVYQPRAGFQVTAQAYDRRSDGLLLVAPAGGDPFATGPFLVGSGVAQGASIDAGLSARSFGLVLSYGFEHVQLATGASTYVPESGAAHRVRLGVTALPHPTLSTRVGLTAILGRRGTPVEGRFEWETNNLLDLGPEFGGSPTYAPADLGASPLPAYYRLDLGIRKQWPVAFMGRGASLALFGTASNLLGRKNVLTYERDPSTGRRTEVEMRPLSPLVVGLDWTF
jgi:hypothetical protein